MKKPVFFILLGSLILVAILTNPDEERHKEVLKAKFNSYMQKSMNDVPETNNEWAQAGQAIGLMLGKTIINEVINNIVSIDNYVLFSTTKVTWKGETRIIGIGAFGNVFLTSQLDEAIDSGLLHNK